MPLSLWQSTCSHLHTEIEWESKGAKGLQSLRSHPSLFSQLAISHCSAALFVFSKRGQKIVRQREEIWTTYILLRENNRVTVMPDEHWPTFKQSRGSPPQRSSTLHNGTDFMKKEWLWQAQVKRGVALQHKHEQNRTTISTSVDNYWTLQMHMNCIPLHFLSYMMQNGQTSTCFDYPEYLDGYPQWMNEMDKIYVKSRSTLG